MFSFFLICESIAAQFLTFVPHAEQTLEEKDSPSSTTTKSSVFSRSANFLNFSLFLVGACNKHIFRAYPSTLKIAELCFEATAAHSAIIRGTRLFWFSPSSRSHMLCWRSASSTHFRSSTIYTTFHHRHYIKLKSALEITGYSVKIRSQVPTITRAILPRNQSASVLNSQRGWSCEQIFDSSTTFLNPLVRTNS